MKFHSDKALARVEKMGDLFKQVENSSKTAEEMGTLNINRFLHLLSLIALIAASQTCFAAEVKFDDLVNNPTRFDRKRVTINGLADVEGDGFWVWRDGRALKRVDVKRAIFVAYEIPAKAVISPYAHANLHFVRVTGTVDTRIHGHLGMDPFSIVLEKVEVLPGPRQKQFLPILAWFRNESDREVKMEVKYKNETAWFTVEPHTINCTGIEKGKGTAVAKTRSERPFAQCALTPPGSQGYYDRDKVAYYYRITTDKIEPVLPTEARHWHFYPMPDRD